MFVRLFLPVVAACFFMMFMMLKLGECDQSMPNQRDTPKKDSRGLVVAGAAACKGEKGGPASGGQGPSSVPSFPPKVVPDHYKKQGGSRQPGPKGVLAENLGQDSGRESPANWLENLWAPGAQDFPMLEESFDPFEGLIPFPFGPTGSKAEGKYTTLPQDSCEPCDRGQSGNFQVPVSRFPVNISQ